MTVDSEGYEMLWELCYSEGMGYSWRPILKADIRAYHMPHYETQLPCLWYFAIESAAVKTTSKASAVSTA